MTCSNCQKEALYEYRLTQKKSLFYCNSHLPAFLEARKKAGLLALTPAHKTAQDEALSALTVKPSEPEEVVVEAAPKKKGSKKKAE